MATKKTEEAYEQETEEQASFERITFNWNGAPYTLEFNRATAKIAEQQYGITLLSVKEGKIANLPEFFYCALLMHHSRIKPAVAMQMFEAMGSKSDLMQCLVYLYGRAIDTLMSEPEEGNAISWQRA